MIRELPDAVVDSNTALARCHVLLRHLYPAQGTHCETLTVQEGHISTKLEHTEKESNSDRKEFLSALGPKSRLVLCLLLHSSMLKMQKVTDMQI